MSDKSKSIIIAASFFFLFAILGYFFDRGLFLSLLSRTGKGMEEEKVLVLDAIRAYNAIYADIYASGGGPKLLNEFPAAKSMRHQLFRDIGFIRDRGRVLVYDLAAMTPIEVSITAYNAAEAVVFEEWNYVYQRKDDRQLISRVKGLGQGLKYRLVKENSRWMVNAWEPVEVVDPLSKDRAPS